MSKNGVNVQDNKNYAMLLICAKAFRGHRSQ